MVNLTRGNSNGWFGFKSHGDLFGLAVFSVIVAVGWRSVQNRRILRMQSANGDETIIVAGEDDEISSVVSSK